MDKKATIREVTWLEVRDVVYKVNAKLAESIDGFNVKERANLYLATYPFGTNVVKDGVLMLPSKDGNIVSIHDERINPSVKHQLNYCTIPPCIWLNTSGEVYVDVHDCRISLNVFNPGTICGLWEVLDESQSLFSQRIWSIAVGGRSIFALPKIGDVGGLKKLEKELAVRHLTTPKSIFEHIDLFSKIANAKENSWKCELLFFSEGWFKERLTSKSWLNFNYRLLRDEWTHSVYWRNKVTFDLLGHIFSLVQEKQNIRPNAYLINTVMHIVAIGIGSSPGFVPVTQNNELCAPTKLIQEELVQSYGLKNYIPMLMCPRYLSTSDFDCQVYYSMQVPTLLSSSQYLRKPHSVLDDMKEVKKLLESLRVYLEKYYPQLFNLLKNVEYEFFHSDVDENADIKHTSQIPKEDARFLDYPDKSRTFCDNSSFLRGCIRITRKKEK